MIATEKQKTEIVKVFLALSFLGVVVHDSNNKTVKLEACNNVTGKLSDIGFYFFYTT